MRFTAWALGGEAWPAEVAGREGPKRRPGENREHTLRDGTPIKEDGPRE